MTEVSQISVLELHKHGFQTTGQIGEGVGYTYALCGWCDLQKSALTTKGREALKSQESTKQDHDCTSLHCAVVGVYLN